MNVYDVARKDDVYNHVQCFLARHWRRCYPEVLYRPFCGESEEDNLWGMDIEEDEGDSLWGDDVGIRIDTPEFEEEGDPVPIHLFITDRCGLWARKIGYEKADDAIIVAPMQLFEDAKIEPKKYDQIDTGSLMLTVVDVKPLGVWSNTSKFVYQSANCRVLCLDQRR